MFLFPYGRSAIKLSESCAVKMLRARHFYINIQQRQSVGPFRSVVVSLSRSQFGSVSQSLTRPDQVTLRWRCSGESNTPDLDTLYHPF